MKLGAEQRYLRGEQMQRDETPIEWERDSMGRKFRRVGKGCIEYAPTITLAGGIEIYEDELEDFHKRQKEAEERRKTQHAEFIEHFKRLWDAEHSAERTKNESCNRTEKHH